MGHAADQDVVGKDLNANITVARFPDLTRGKSLTGLSRSTMIRVARGFMRVLSRRAGGAAPCPASSPRAEM
jgi:hypothetical protein